MNDKNREVLPAKYPFIDNYPTHANTLSILLNYEETEDWIYNNFVNIWVMFEKNGQLEKFEHTGTVLYNHCPYLKIYDIPRYIVKKKYDTFADFIIDSIDNGNYLNVSYDPYFIPHTEAYQSWHQEHSIFVYGYDKESMQFYVADFFKNFKYSYELVSFDQMNEAMDSSIFEEIDQLFHTLHYQNVQYTFDIHLFLKDLNNYLCSERTILNYEISSLNYDEYIRIKDGYVFYGIYCYEALINELRKIEQDENIYIDLRRWHFLHSHKVIATKRLFFLEEKGYIKDINKLLPIFEEIEKECLIMENVLIKVHITKNKGALDRIRKRLEYVREIETIALNELINEIKSNL